MRKTVLIGLAIVAVQLSVAAPAKVYNGYILGQTVPSQGGENRDLYALSPSPKKVWVALNPDQPPPFTVTLSAQSAQPVTVILYDYRLNEVRRTTTANGSAVLTADLGDTIGYIRVVPTGSTYDTPAGSKFRRTIPAVPGDTALLPPYRISFAYTGATSQPAATIAAAPLPAAPAALPGRQMVMNSAARSVLASQSDIGENGDVVFSRATWGAYFDALGATGTPAVGKGYIRDFNVVSEGPQGVIRRFTARLDFSNLKGKMYLNEWWASPSDSTLQIWYVRFTNDGRAIKRGDANGQKFSNLMVRPDGSIVGKYGKYNMWGGYSWAEFRWTGSQLIFDHYAVVGEGKGAFLYRDTYTPAAQNELTRQWALVRQQIKDRKAANGGGGGMLGMLAGAALGGALTGGSAEGMIAGARVLGTKGGAQQVYNEYEDRRVAQEQQAASLAAAAATVRARDAAGQRPANSTATTQQQRPATGQSVADLTRQRADLDRQIAEARARDRGSAGTPAGAGAGTAPPPYVPPVAAPKQMCTMPARANSTGLMDTGVTATRNKLLTQLRTWCGGTAAQVTSISCKAQSNQPEAGLATCDADYVCPAKQYPCPAKARQE